MVLMSGLVCTAVYCRRKRRGLLAYNSYYTQRYDQFYMRNPYRQAIAAVLIAGMFLLGTPDKVWATDPDPLPDLIYYHNDHLGSSSIITNGDSGSEGAVVHNYVYTPFGDESYALSTYDNVSNRYTGQVLDDEVGLYYYNARYYDPELSRFIQADSEFSTGVPDSQALNRYSYCINNPLVYTDPTGNFLGIDDLIVLGIVAGGILGGVQSEVSGGNFWDGAWKGAVAGGISGAMVTFGVPVMQPFMGEFASTIACAAGGGALSTAITGGDVGMSAITSAITAGIGIRLGFQHPSLLDPGQWGQYVQELVVSAGVSAVVGGTVAEIQGGNFWAAASDAAIWGAAGYVLTSILNKDYGQEGPTAWDYVTEVGGGFLSGAWDGIKANLGLVDGDYMEAEYGTAGKISNYARYVSEAAGTAAGVGGLAKQGTKLLAKGGVKAVKTAAKGSIDDVGKAVRGAICFTAGTLVYTERGMVPISKVKIGDYVWSYNFETPENELCKIVKTFERTTDTIVVISVGDETIETTQEHPFWVVDKGWTEAKFLAKGQELCDVDGNSIAVQKIEFEDKTEIVYNFEVEGKYNYYITTTKVLVHNKCSITDAAKELGFNKTKRLSHGQTVFQGKAKGGIRYLSPDVDSHSGGVWKAFDRNMKRLGTYDAKLNRIGD